MKDKDDNELLRDGKLPEDPFDGTGPMNTKGEPLDWRSLAQPVGVAYSVENLKEDRKRPMLSLATLPRWVDDNDPHSHGHGWGDALNKMLGGGVSPGSMIAVGASRAGAGKTAWIMQIADGLGLRTEQIIEENKEDKKDPLTPVLWLSEMPVDRLSKRTLARWIGVDSRLFPAGSSGRDVLDASPDYIDAAWDAGEIALSSESLLGRARNTFIQTLNPTEKRGSELVADVLTPFLNGWVAYLKQQYEREVWPVIVIDPIQRWHASTANEVEALNELIETLSTATTANGWIVLLTSDTNKTSASGDNDDGKPADRAAAGFRGSYKLIHLVDAALYLDCRKELSPGLLEFELIIVKNRWGPSTPYPKYKWDIFKGMRFYPQKPMMDKK